MITLEDAKYVLRIGPNQTVEVDVNRDTLDMILRAHTLNNLYNIERALARLAKRHGSPDID